MRRDAAAPQRQPAVLAVPTPPAAPVAEPTVAELRTLTERLLLAGLREQEIAEQCRRAEEALRVSYDEEHRARTRVEQLAAERQAMLGQIAEGILIADAAGRPIYSNAAARRLLGLAEPGGAGDEAADDAAPAALGDPVVAAQLARAVGGHEPIRDLPRRIRRPDGTEVVTDGTATPFFEASGELLGAVLVLRDMTAEADWERRKDAFLAAVAHDLRNPLTAIRGFAELLVRRGVRAGSPGGDQWVESLEQIESAATQMNAMIDDLLDLGRLQLGQPPPLAREPTDLVALARRALADQQQRTTDRRLLLESALDTLVGRWDAARLERALANLLGNAVKYSPAGGAVVLRLGREARPNGDWSVLSVEDHGLGVPARELPHLFEGFRRGSNVVGRIEGTGVGLASAQQIVVQHGGTLSAESVEGQGSTFTMRLPLAAPEEAQPDEEAHSGSQGTPGAG